MPTESTMPIRPRRLRLNPALRSMLRETELSPSDFIYPLFIVHGQGLRNEVASMPGVFQLSVDQLAAEARELVTLGIPAVILFGIPARKDPVGLENFADDGIVQQAIRALKAAAPDLIVITDVCLCEYTDHGHCGILNVGKAAATPRPYANLPEGYLLNDETLEVLAKVSISHAAAGADIVAPSGMIDGAVAAIRAGLDAAGFAHLPILSYAIKYASAFYGPFRDAAHGTPQFGDRRTHQMDVANAREALREARLDADEGADMLMVKPAGPYLDIIRQTRQEIPSLPLVGYQVSGEYAMLKAAARNGWLDEPRAAIETLTAIKRAGADLIITYYAKEAVGWLKQTPG